MECKHLYPGGPLYSGDAVSTDTLALASFIRSDSARRGVELGCGSGLLMLTLLFSHPALSMTGADIREEAVSQARRNLAANSFESRGTVLLSDYRALPLPKGSFDLVCANPPYFPASAAASPDARRDTMRRESATLAETAAVASSLLRPGGSFSLVHRAERMAEVFAALREVSLEPKRLRLFSARAESAPSLFFLEARKGAHAGLVLEPLLYQFTSSGAETEEYRKLCHWEA